MGRKAIAVLVCAAAICAVVPRAVAQERGTLGLGVAQLYDDNAPEKRGNLVVLNVPPDYPGAKAGVQVGDLITDVDGVSVRGRDVAEIARTTMHGPPGEKVVLKLVRPSTAEPFEVTLVRSAYHPQENPATDPFKYVTPGDWGSERHNFPIEWAPSLPYHGLEDIKFAPGFADPKSPDYWSYLFFWWLAGKPSFTARQLQADLVTYYRGLSDGFAKQGKFQADLNKVTATTADTPVEGLYRGTVTTYDFAGKLITLRTEVVVHPCLESDNTVVFFSLSPQPFDASIWGQMKAIRDSFRCARK